MSDGALKTVVPRFDMKNRCRPSFERKGPPSPRSELTTGPRFSGADHSEKRWARAGTANRIRMQPPRVRMPLLIRRLWLDVVGIVICSFQFGLLTGKPIEGSRVAASKGDRSRRISSGASNSPPSSLTVKTGAKTAHGNRNFFLDIVRPGVSAAERW